MNGEKKMFVALNKEREWTVTFTNDNSTKIMGKGTISIGSKDALAKNVLLIENMKNNMISVNLICN